MNNVEKIFAYYDSYGQQAGALDFDAIIEASENWLDRPDALELEEPSREDIRKGIQLALIKAMKQSAQVHHQMTPDSIGFLIGYLANKLVKTDDAAVFLDPAAGTGNLLFTVMNQYEKQAAGIAVEIDDVLIQLAAASANLLELPVSFYLQDALRPLPFGLADAVAADLPVGYYPDDETAMDYELMPKEGHAFSHYLYIEQSMRYTKPGGWGFFVVPARLLTAEGAEPILNFVKEHNLLRGVFELPGPLFSDPRFAKSILLLQNPPEDEQFTAPDVLLAKVPDLGNAAAMQSFFEKVNRWAQ